MHVERPVPRRSCLVVPNRFAEGGVARLANDCDDQSHLRVNAAEFVDAGDSADGEHVGGGAHVDAALPGKIQYIVKAAPHDRLEALVDQILGPEVPAAILYPLEVRDRHATGVGEDVRDNEHAVLVKNGIGRSRCRAVGSLTDDPRLDVTRVPRGDDVLQGGGKQHIDVERQQIGTRYDFRLAVSIERPILFYVGNGIIDVDALLVVQRDRSISDRDDLATLARQKLGRDRADVAKALNRDGRSFHRHHARLLRVDRVSHRAPPVCQ